MASTFVMSKCNYNRSTTGLQQVYNRSTTGLQHQVTMIKGTFQVTFNREHLTYIFQNFKIVSQNIGNSRRNQRKPVEL